MLMRSWQIQRALLNMSFAVMDQFVWQCWLYHLYLLPYFVAYVYYGDKGAEDMMISKRLMISASPITVPTVANPPPWDGVVQDGEAEIKELITFKHSSGFMIDIQMTSEFRTHRDLLLCVMQEPENNDVMISCSLWWKPGVGDLLVCKWLCHELSLHLNRKVARCPWAWKWNIIERKLWRKVQKKMLDNLRFAKLMKKWHCSIELQLQPVAFGLLHKHSRLLQIYKCALYMGSDTVLKIQPVAFGLFHIQWLAPLPAYNTIWWILVVRLATQSIWFQCFLAVSLPQPYQPKPYSCMPVPILSKIIGHHSFWNISPHLNILSSYLVPIKPQQHKCPQKTVPNTICVGLCHSCNLL